MMSTDRFASLEALIRNTDRDRYLASLFAPAHLRGHLFALYAFNYEIAKTADNVSQPVMGQIRLQWWREAVDELYSGRVRNHEVAQAFAEAVRAHDLPRGLLDQLIDARENDLDEAPFEDWHSLKAYADATSGHVMRLAARILGAGARLDHAAHEAGIAYALLGLLRAFPFHASRRRLMLPVEALRKAALSQEQILAGEMAPNVAALFGATVQRALDHLESARKAAIPRAFLPALLPAATVPLYAKILVRPGFNPFRDSTEISIHRRQLAMLRAMMRGRL
ncbi:MAG TPA: phytoene/squalene synthase family protein [Micropepsaceae bacterium]|jgi:phytoene synthase|nr:phytoene/squalene synthase family protein [Micropepsaceae bacterium]